MLFKVNYCESNVEPLSNMHTRASAYAYKCSQPLRQKPRSVANLPLEEKRIQIIFLVCCDNHL